MHRFHLGVAVLGSAIGLLTSAPAHAFTYGTGYLTSWAGCESACSVAKTLSYTDDQILMFESEMNAAGHSRTHRYTNSNVWASDYVEDNFGGQDDQFFDDGDVYAFAGHGRVVTKNNQQVYEAPTCLKGTFSTCILDADWTRVGERSGIFSLSEPGDLRFLILATCNSVDTTPSQEWDQTLRAGGDLVMGYRGTIVDSSNTDEVLADLATNAFAGSWTFKSAWFYAVEDWWYDDTGGIVASGTTDAQANDRLNNLKKTWSRRPAGELHDKIASAYHEG